MATNANAIAFERAFELAKSGQYVNVGEIKYRLHIEGYVAGAMPTAARRCRSISGAFTGSASAFAA